MLYFQALENDSMHSKLTEHHSLRHQSKSSKGNCEKLSRKLVLCYRYNIHETVISVRLETPVLKNKQGRKILNFDKGNIHPKFSRKRSDNFLNFSMGRNYMWPTRDINSFAKSRSRFGENWRHNCAAMVTSMSIKLTFFGKFAQCVINV